MRLDMFYDNNDQFNALTEMCNQFATLPSLTDKDVIDEEVEQISIKAKPLSTDDWMEEVNAIEVDDDTIDPDLTPVIDTPVNNDVTIGETMNKIYEMGIGSSFKHSMNAFKGESLGYESPFSENDFVTRKGCPHIFIVVCNDGEGCEIAKPTCNRSEFRQFSDGIWPRCHCDPSELTKCVEFSLPEINSVLKYNAEADKNMLSELCPDYYSEPEYDTDKMGALQITEAFNGKGFDATPMEKAKQVKINNSMDKIPNNFKEKVFNDDGHLQQNTEAVFNKINSRFAEMFNLPYETAMKDADAPCNKVYEGGQDAVWGNNPIKM